MGASSGCQGCRFPFKDKRRYLPILRQRAFPLLKLFCRYFRKRGCVNASMHCRVVRVTGRFPLRNDPILYNYSHTCRGLYQPSIRRCRPSNHNASTSYRSKGSSYEPNTCHGQLSQEGLQFSFLSYHRLFQPYRMYDVPIPWALIGYFRRGLNDSRLLRTRVLKHALPQELGYEERRQEIQQLTILCSYPWGDFLPTGTFPYGGGCCRAGVNRCMYELPSDAQRRCLLCGRGLMRAGGGPGCVGGDLAAKGDYRTFLCRKIAQWESVDT